MNNVVTAERFKLGETVTGSYFGHRYSGAVFGVTTCGDETFICVRLHAEIQVNTVMRKYVTLAIPTDIEEGDSTIQKAH